MQSLKSAIDRILPGLEFEGMSNVSGEYQIKFNNRDGQSVNYDQPSSGERDVIAILFSLVEGEIESKLSEVNGSSPDESDIIILLDGPESYLHPKLQRELLHFLRKLVDSNPMNDRDAQAIICTHSPTILDLESSNELHFMVFPDQCNDNQTGSAKDIDIDLMRSIIGGPGTSSLSTGTPLLLVEGDADYDVLIQLFDGFEDNITVRPIYGKGKITRLSAAFDDLVL